MGPGVRLPRLPALYKAKKRWSLAEQSDPVAQRTWHLLVADDFHLDASGPEYRAALLLFFVLCDTCRVPLSWAKTSGGDTVACMGRVRTSSFELMSADIATKSRLVCQMVTGGCFFHVREHEEIRGGTWTYHVCRRCTRI